MARALIVGCGCRGRQLGGRLLDAGWQVRGTSRSAGGRALIEAAGLAAAAASPDRLETVLEQVHDVAVVCWLMGSAKGSAADLEAINGPRVESLLERLVDTPVRGFVYEGAGSVDGAHLGRGGAAALRAAETWRIPVQIVAVDPADPNAWTDAMAAAATRVLDPRD